MSDSELILKKILDTPDDEKTGAHAKRGFRYQDWWSTLKTFQVWSYSNSDFVIGTEVKEDLTIIDSLTKPQLIEFYQVKKRKSK
ncbi:dsDNA nuclease domain-containing protein [Acinetobacter sp. YH12041]|uniref:dsDNA nuclease domain-containing protein n=1 Tax=Acinetobacter sp. YH12041 TaxID=2601049 RepID=UPI0015D175D3|nr:dsDNA nuclease domain-containing protein [Acinetobacter sp. YH12041]